MIEEITTAKSNFDLTKKSAFSKEDEVFTSRSYAALLAKNTIPYSHKKLADNYMIIKQNKDIFSFKYSQIKKIFKEKKLKLSKYSSYKEYLHIITNDNEFIILTISTILVGEDYRDISNYLIKKNADIKID